MMFATAHDENERSDVMMQIKVHKAVKTHSVRFFKNLPLTIFCAILAQNELINEKMKIKQIYKVDKNFLYISLDVIRATTTQIAFYFFRVHST